MDGKYVVKIGEYYLSITRNINNGLTFNFNLEKNIKDAELMSLDVAKEMQMLVGSGKVLRINLELEEVE